eukprot:23551-Pleurochrysis_carterae.AAC.1
MVAFTRACKLIDLLIPRPMRWLAGKATLLIEWLPYKMGWVYELLEHALAHTADSGDYLLEPSLNIFEAVADEQPRF